MLVILFLTNFKTIDMATTNTGVLGVFIGTIGPVTGFMRNGKNVLRSSNSSIKNKRTPLQLAQREKINICNGFIRAFTGTDFLLKAFRRMGIQVRAITG